MSKPNYWQLYYAKRKRRRWRRRPHYRKPDLSMAKILHWVDEFKARIGGWPRPDSGHVPGGNGETWLAIHDALRKGRRGLPGGSSLPRFLAEHRGYRNMLALPPLTERQILGWADAFQERSGTWPSAYCGPVQHGSQDTWRHIDNALRRGSRGLAGGSSLAQFLESKRGVANRKNRPRLSYRQVLAWTDAHHARTGKWPKATSGPVAGAPGETWSSIHAALNHGARGLPGSVSLAQLLARHRGARNLRRLPRYTTRQILAWADAHHERTGHWPYSFSGPIPEAPGETWKAVASALRIGRRGLPGGTTLTRLLEQQRGMRNRQSPPSLTVHQILVWADRYRQRTGRWPRSCAEPIPEAAGETWEAVNRALKQSKRGLRGGTSLAQLLLKHRQVRSQSMAPRLQLRQIHAWCKAHEHRTGRWPTAKTGPVQGVAGETWGAIEKALRQSLRGLAKGWSLARLRTLGRFS